MSTFLQLVKERVVVYNGAMGTNIQKRNTAPGDYWGKENRSEVLVLSRRDRSIKKKLEENVMAPGWLESKVACGYFAAQGDGSDVVLYEPDAGKAASFNL